MHRLLSEFVLLTQKCSVSKTSIPLRTANNQKCVELKSPDLITASIAHNQTQTAAVVNESLGRVESIPLMEPSSTEISSENFEVSTPKIFTQATIDKTPLPFEEIPGPSILKLWEKYWKYVPLLGTQLFCSLLINRFTEGQLNWNRNVTPLKYLFNEYGCIVRIRGPLVGDIVMIHRPEHIAEVFKQEGQTPIRSGIDILQHYRQNYRKYGFAGPFSLQGSEWLEVREKVHEPISGIASTFFNKIDMVCDELINKIRNVRNKQDEVPGNFHEDLTLWGIECFCTLMFDKHLGFLEPTGFNSTSDPARIINALKTAHVYMNRCETGFQVWRFFETPFSKKLFTACDTLDEIIEKYICQAQKKIKDRSASTYENNFGSGGESLSVVEKLLLKERIHPDHISTLAMDMVMLGVQATANCEAFLLYFLAKNPRVQKKLHDEIISVLSNRGRFFGEKDLNDMPYLKACLKESLRLRPAFPYITRQLPQTITLHGYTIPKGTFVIMANQITSQREENFENPERFRPERWLGNCEENESHVEYSYLPFGHGVRSCLGKNMVETEMMLLTAKLIRQFRIEYDYANIGSKFCMVNTPNKPLRFRFVDRD